MSAPYTIDGVQLTEAQARRIAMEVEQRDAQPVIVPDQIYVPVHPINRGDAYRFHNGRWEFNWSYSLVEFDWASRCCEDKQIVKRIHKGDLVPYVPPAPIFVVGDWVQHKTQPWAKARQVNGFTTSEWSSATHVQMKDATEWYVSDLRHATPEEIAAAKRIEPTAGMLLQQKSSGDVYWLSGGGVDGWYGRRLCQPDVNQNATWIRTTTLTTDHYTVLDSYTVTGAKQ